MGLVLVFYNSDLSFLASWQVVLMVHDPVGKYFPVAPGSDLWGAAPCYRRRCRSPVSVPVMYRLMTDEDYTAVGYDGWASRSHCSLICSSVAELQTNVLNHFMIELVFGKFHWQLHDGTQVSAHGLDTGKTVSMYSKYSLLFQLYVTPLRLDSNMLFSWICKYPLRLAYGKLSVSVSII